jgi:hypothetical protein
MAFEKIINSIQDLNASIKALGKSSAEYYKLDIYRKITKGIIGTITGILLLFFGIFMLLFLSIAVAISISTAMDIPSVGFYIVGGFYLFLIILLLVIGKDYIRKTVLVKSSKKIFND